MTTVSIAFLYFFVLFDICLNVILIAFEVKKQKAKKNEGQDNEKK